MNRLIWLNREKITLLIGNLSLLMGAVYTWYRLPPQALNTFGTNLFLANVFRCFAALLAIIIVPLALWYGISRVPRLPFWGALIAVLLFPYMVVTWCPTVTFLAAAYYDQEQQISEHVERNFTEIQAHWKQNITLSESRPLTSIFQLSIQDSRFFQMSSWDRVFIDVFGYKNSFLAFIDKGWSFTVIGLLITLMGLYLGLETPDIDAFLQDMRGFLPGIGLLLGLIIFSTIWANIVNQRLDTLFVKGEYHQVVATSQALASWYPPLRGDEEFLKRMAEAGYYGNEPDRALIEFVKGLQRYRVGDFLKAKEYFQKSLILEPNRFLVRGYLAAALLNEGVDYFSRPTLPYTPHRPNYPNIPNNFFNPISPNNPNNLNNRKPTRATDLFEQTLQVFPGHLIALYDLMLTRVVNREFEKSAEIAQEIIDLYEYFQQPNLGILGQAYLHFAWADYHNGDDVKEAWKRYRQSIDTRAWKESLKK